MAINLARRSWIDVAAAAALTFVGAAIASGDLLLIAGPVTLALIIVFVRLPLFVFALCLVSSATIFDVASTPRVTMLHIPQLLVVIGAAAAAMRGVSMGGWFGRLVLVVIGMSVLEIAVTGAGRHSGSMMIMFAAFWIALSVWMVHPKRTLQVFVAAGVFVAAVSVLQYLLHSSHTLFVASDLPETLREQDGFFRVRAPGLTTAYVALIFALCRIAWGRSRSFGAVAIAAALVPAIVLSLNRNMLLGIMVGLAVAWLVSRGRGRAASLAAVVVIAAGASLFFYSSSGIGQRILSLGNKQYLEATTLSDRQYENALAWTTIKSHPVLGVGWDASYGAMVVTPDGNAVSRSYIHNQYYGLWLRTGVIGVGAFVLLMMLTLIEGLRLARGGDWLGSALVASVVALGLSSVVGIYIINGDVAAVWSLLFAMAAGSRLRRVGGENERFLRVSQA